MKCLNQRTAAEQYFLVVLIVFQLFQIMSLVKSMLLYHFKQATVFTRISAAALIKFFAPQMWRLFEGGAYLRAALI